MSEAPAIKIDAGSVARCKLPPPSRELFERMARAFWEEAAERADQPDAKWGGVPEYQQENLVAAAAAAYRTLALFAGARAEGVNPCPREPVP